MKIDEMNFEVGQMWRNRLGQKVMIVEVDIQDPWPVKGYNYSNRKINEFGADGGYDVSWVDNDFDLVKEWGDPKTGVKYINVYYSGDFGSGEPTREKADEIASPSRLACVRVEWTEGQFDE